MIPVGTLEQRKLKVRNIDANNVTVADLQVSKADLNHTMLLQKLFSKCGPLITAGFDRNMQGQYLGSATLIYAKASSASNAIK